MLMSSTAGRHTGTDTREPITIERPGEEAITVAETDHRDKAALFPDNGPEAIIIEVVDNDGNHTAPTEKCEPVYMAAGEYGIEIDYFYQSSLGVKVLFSWNRDGGAASTPVPTSVLFKPGT